ncbi:MAG: hypothetical protein HZB85_10580 [Deltaproteobacteria bacterium]|nr:hypothetical protein [Deltaproteobacteria bacterium]
MKFHRPLLPALLAAAFLILLLTIPRNSIAAVSFTKFKTYSNAETGLRFDYPDDYVLKELLTPDGGLINVLVGVKHGKRPRWLLDVSVVDSADYPSSMYGGERSSVSPRQFALEEAMRHCTADGPDGGVSCEEVIRSEDFKTDRSLAGFVIFLKEISTHIDENGVEDRQEDTRGPVYAFDISHGPSIKLIMAEPAFWSIESPLELETVRAIIGTFRIGQPQ